MGCAATVIGAALAVTEAVGCGAAPSREAPLGVDEEMGSIVGGESDTGDPGVVAVYAQQPGQPGGFLCTGSLIAPTIVLTAAHCVSESETGANATFTVLTSANVNRSGGLTLAVREVHANPRWSAKRLEGGHDQGIVVLAQAASLPVLPINRQTLPSALRGKPVRIVGYGLNDGSAQTGAGIKRQAVTSLGAIQTNLIAVGDSRRGTCNGDSGGPAFMSLSGQETIVGTTSYGNADCSDGGFDARVDTDLAFIDPYLLATCTPVCTGRSCGGDGCGGTCGACGAGELCTEAGQCSPMTTDCAGGGQEQEPNNSALQANPLCADGTARGAFSSSVDPDWFTWIVPSDSVYDAVLSEGSAGAALRVYKLSSTGRLSFIGDGPEVSRHTDVGGSYVARILPGASPAASYRLTVTSTP
jgi:V8-like Glu-specific endopeptidase